MPTLPTDRVRRLNDLHRDLRDGREPLDETVPLALVSKAEGTQRLMAVDGAAGRLGLEMGMALAQARAMVPALRVMAHDDAADTRLLEAIADWADRYTPLVGRDPPHGLILDITGAAHLLGGEQALVSDLVDRLGRQGMQARVAIAPSVGAAWALCRCSDGATILPETMTQAGLDAALAPLPVSGLRLAPETTAALRRVGLKRIGDLTGRPRGPLAARFGASVIVRLDQARGIDTEAISPRQPVPPAVVEQNFAEPILTTAAVERCCGDLAGQLSAVLDERGQGATAVQLSVYRVDGLVKRIDLRLASPSRDGPTLAGLLALRLGHLDDPLDPGFGYDLVRLAAVEVAHQEAEARHLAGVVDDASPVELAQALTAIIDRLTARFGEGRVHTIALAPTHLPEAAARLVPVRAAALAPDSAGSAGPGPRHRPLRLLDPPEPVDVMAEVPDGPPIHLRWRRRPLRIVAAHGPERIAPEWWRPHALAEAMRRDETRDYSRDYWRIEDATGRRLWLYREGVYGAGEPSADRRPPRWYVHGLFG